MDTQVGIRGNGFTMLCCDSRAVHSIITIKDDEDKLVPITKHQMFALSGEAGDRVNFCEYIVANVKLYALRHSHTLTTNAVANFTRSELAKALRQGPFHTNLLLGGYDEDVGASLYWMDYLGTMHKMNICGNGYGAYFSLPMFEKQWHPELTRDEALLMMKKAVAEIKKRLVVAPAAFQVKVISKDGIEDLGQI